MQSTHTWKVGCLVSVVVVVEVGRRESFLKCLTDHME